MATVKNERSLKMININDIDIQSGIELQEKIFDIFDKQISREQSEIFEDVLRNSALPPIKGEITKGKIKWRGIKLMTYYTSNGFVKWVEQRGVIISPKITLYFNK
jgi:hypothetical protein